MTTNLVECINRTNREYRRMVSVEDSLIDDKLIASVQIPSVKQLKELAIELNVSLSKRTTTTSVKWYFIYMGVNYWAKV